MEANLFRGELIVFLHDKTHEVHDEVKCEDEDNA
jgi:hypothetical protein